MIEEYVYYFGPYDLNIEINKNWKETHNIAFARFGGYGLASYECDNIFDANQKLKKGIEKINGRILPLPITNSNLEEIMYRIRCKAHMNLMLAGSDISNIFIKNLQNIKKRLGRDLSTREKQCKRLKKLMGDIKKFEENKDENIKYNIINELVQLGIFYDSIR